MASEIIVNGITYNVVQINGQKIAEVTNYFGPAAPENAEVSLRLCPSGRPTGAILMCLWSFPPLDLHKQYPSGLDGEGDPADRGGTRICGQTAPDDALLGRQPWLLLRAVRQHGNGP